MLYVKNFKTFDSKIQYFQFKIENLKSFLNSIFLSMNTIYVRFLFLSLTFSALFADAQNSLLPKLIEKNGRHAFLVDGKPFLILAGQAHNSSGWSSTLPDVWASIETMHANTLEVPIYWEQIEAQQGKFDFSLIDTLLTQARQRNKRLVLLWFATWKNGSNHYMPDWMKRYAEKYPNITGKNGQPIDSPAPVEAAMEADAKAFAAVMRYLRNTDEQHTIIMVQVENEPGSWGSVRDYSARAQKLFEQPVPSELLKPEVFKALNLPVVSGGNWQTVYGTNADEYFNAYFIAKFIGKVAAAGKAEYPLPLYVNAALRDPLTNPTANNYESGGPTDNVIPIWKVAAPAVDLLAPDIYLSEHDKILKVIELYNRPDNPLFVPEFNFKPENAKYFYDVLGHGGIGFSPFGIDVNGKYAQKSDIAERLAPYAQEYAMAEPMMRELAQWSFDGKIASVIEREDHANQTIDLGAWQAIVQFGDGNRNKPLLNAQPQGKTLFVKLDDNTFIVTGTLSRVSFKPLGKNADRAWQYIKVEEGRYVNGAFKSERILNGDETDWGGPYLGNVPSVLRIKLVVR